VIEGDYQVNKLEMEIDEMCSQIIARRQPAASDLRELMVVGRACTDLERMGDAAKKIARLGQQLAKLNPLYQPNYRELKRVSALARTMLSRVLDAFARHDLDLAQGIVRQDDEVDNEYRTVMRHLVAYMIDDPRAISTSLEILFIAKAFEQIGDHARSIAQQLVYLVNGRDGRISSE
jgi:phosphate transport system protein